MLPMIPLPIRPTDHISLEVLQKIPAPFRLINLCVYRDPSGKNISAIAVAVPKDNDATIYICATDDGRILNKTL